MWGYGLDRAGSGQGQMAGIHFKHLLNDSQFCTRLTEQTAVYFFG
jgi:hypothetical protein